MSLKRKKICEILVIKKTTTSFTCVLSFQSGTKISIQEGQRPVELMFSLNLVINVKSHNSDKEKPENQSKLDPNVHKTAKVLMMADKHVAQQRTIDRTVVSME
jgi:hypothetical protein